MILRATTLAVMLAGAPALAQDDGGAATIFDGAEELFGNPSDPFNLEGQGFVTEERRDEVTSSARVVVRGLDKLTGEVTDIELTRGETVVLGRIQLTLGDCRYPSANPSGNAYAYLVIRESGEDVPEFAGWMVASSPALNALEHPRYDVWVLRCVI